MNAVPVFVSHRALSFSPSLADFPGLHDCFSSWEMPFSLRSRNLQGEGGDVDDSEEECGDGGAHVLRATLICCCPTQRRCCLGLNFGSPALSAARTMRTTSCQQAVVCKKSNVAIIRLYFSLFVLGFASLSCRVTKTLALLVAACLLRVLSMKEREREIL